MARCPGRGGQVDIHEGVEVQFVNEEGVRFAVEGAAYDTNPLVWAWSPVPLFADRYVLKGELAGFLCCMKKGQWWDGDPWGPVGRVPGIRLWVPFREG